MKKVQLKVIEEIVDFTSEDLNESTKELANFDFTSDNRIEDEIEDFFTKIFLKKGDWASFDIHLNENIIYIEITLIFTNPELLTEDFAVQKTVLNECSKYVEENSKSIIENQKFTSTDLDGYLISINQPGISTLNYINLKQAFDKENINYKIESKFTNQTEVGAGGGESDIILFIANTVASGVSWDVVKSIITTNIDYFSHKGFLSNVIEKRKFKKVRKIVADKARVDEENLILHEFVNEVENVKMVFKSPNGYIYICCDSEKDIRKYKLSNKKTIFQLFRSETTEKN
ncbi:hypothetical protein SAMN04487943_101226 [Gracilibacillus orientalis]|uniref:Uncharacterized protein n=1 Tax=Gracilibacillus orientalis TaxID=334253 RepID=A0A1I4H7B5_9BACI|nr:hypothetical protein [Gracilibacillus orientalis]SFL37281.1 hypothetical protein SAMN04487943_101226 [Gracilibacillus orientalis]